VGNLVVITTQDSFQLAEALRKGEVDRALELINSLMQRNEPPSKLLRPWWHSFAHNVL
jgi:DNA polymerase III delta subunit